VSKNKVLFLEDDPAFIEVVRVMNKELHDVELIHFCDPVDAFAALSNFEFAFGILDYQLHTWLDGREFGQYLKARGIPYCIYTAYGPDEIKDPDARFVYQKGTSFIELIHYVIGVINDCQEP
jgi:DNA-binding NarL/FixJ family response regulator